MELTKKEEQELIEWGIKFFDLGFKSAMNIISKTMIITHTTKINAVREYIKTIMIEKEKIK